MFVYFNAEDAQVKLSIDSNVVGYADNAKQLANLLSANNVTADNDMYFSSSVDFASEEGFATDDCAHNIIEAALDML